MDAFEQAEAEDRADYVTRLLELSEAKIQRAAERAKQHLVKFCNCRGDYRCGVHQILDILEPPTASG